MFRDQITGRLSRPGDACHRLITEVAKRQYTRRVLNEETNQLETVVVSEGTEIVKELNVTKDGLEQWTAANPNGPAVVSRPSLEGKYPKLSVFLDTTPWWLYETSMVEETFARRRRF